MKIIVGTDFSEHALRAGTTAAALARRLGDTVRVLHTHEFGGLEPVSPGVLDTLFARARAQLDKESRRLRASGAVVKAELVNGLPDEAIVREATAKDVRMVVVASLGRRAPERWLLGSVSERVAQRSPAPTLVVRHEGPLVAWARDRRPLRVLCAYDFTTTADAALAQLAGLRAVGPLDIIIAQVNWPFADKRRLGVAGPVSLESNAPEVQAVLERDLREKVAATLGREKFRVRVESSLGRPEFRLMELAVEERADLVITGTHQWRGAERLWHTSTSRGLLHHAPMNVLVVPVSADTTRSIPEIHRVLATTDLSPLGDEAVAHAYSLVKPGGSVHLLHVAAPFHGPNPLIGGQFKTKPRTKREHAQAIKEATASLCRLVPPDAEARGTATEIEVVEHPEPAAAICQAAERFGADAICLASHGRSGLSAAVLGSVAQAVMTHSSRPVYVVRAKRR